MDLFIWQIDEPFHLALILSSRSRCGPGTVVDLLPVLQDHDDDDDWAGDSDVLVLLHRSFNLILDKSPTCRSFNP